MLNFNIGTKLKQIIGLTLGAEIVEFQDEEEN